MIFVMLGTSPYPFIRLVREVDRLAGIYSLDVLIQMGNTSCPVNNCKVVSFLDHFEVLQEIQASEFLILQGGAGSIHDGLACGKKIIAVPRYIKYNETKAEQEPLVRKLDMGGIVVGIYKISELENAILDIDNFVPSELRNCQIPEIIKQFLEEIEL